MGNAGDRKNDGYLRSERTLFQVYAPNEISANDATAKINETSTVHSPIGNVLRHMDICP